MMNKYTHHLSVAFVVSLEKFPTIGHKKSLPEIRFSIRTGRRGVLRGIYSWTVYKFCVLSGLLNDYSSLFKKNMQKNCRLNLL